MNLLILRFNYPFKVNNPNIARDSMFWEIKTILGLFDFSVDTQLYLTSARSKSYVSASKSSINVELTKDKKHKTTGD